jgi:hypothetical protein
MINVSINNDVLIYRVPIEKRLTKKQCCILGIDILVYDRSDGSAYCRKTISHRLKGELTFSCQTGFPPSRNADRSVVLR